jgi:hypothetical protein
MTKTLLDAQTTVELPAREMLAFFNWSVIGANQQAGNQSTQLNLLGLFQANGSAQGNANTIVVVQD